jgi:ABC-type multidrug transport system fused ATPase/permease subunit
MIPTALSGSVAAERIRELTQLPREPRKDPARLEGGCEMHLENVQVSYIQGRKVLKDVNMLVPRGKIVALVGPSGEGKTTLLRLMLGLIPPEKGAVYLLDGADKRHSLGADTRHGIAYVPQGNTMIAGTVRENLLLGCPDADDSQLRRALEDACAWDFVQRLPRQLDTPIGEGGKGLSEGQAQRVSIARALLRDAPVLLLDEVTSALDRDTERRVLENLTHRQVTTVVTTHRPSILSQCAHAYRVKDGQVQRLEKEELEKLARGETDG